MSSKAIDIVLLPPDNIMKLCVDLCNTFPSSTDQYTLNLTDNLPHISLFMGQMADESLSKLSDDLESIASSHTEIHTELTSLVCKKKDDSSTRYFFEIAKTKELQQLHMDLVDRLEVYHATGTTSDMYIKKQEEQILQETIDWTDNYTTNASKENFWPHITLKGCDGNPSLTEHLPIPMQLNRLALCHMGNRNTCREILFEIKLT